MANYLVQIIDKRERMMNLKVDYSSYDITWGEDKDPIGTWRALDLGFLRYTSGKIYKQSMMELQGTWSQTRYWYHLKLYSANGPVMSLDSFTVGGYWGAIARGTGTVYQPAVIGFEPGTIKWNNLELI